MTAERLAEMLTRALPKSECQRIANTLAGSAPDMYYDQQNTDTDLEFIDRLMRRLAPETYDRDDDFK